MPETRPALSRAVSSTEFARWYWSKVELTDFARELGLRVSGGKSDIAERIAAALDGRPIPEPTTPRRASSRQLASPLTPDTVIPPGQRCSQVLRAWLTEQVDPRFHFDAAMREFIAAADGSATLADAAARWHATRAQPAGEIGEQFELNRFTRQWHLDHPGGDRADLLDAWRAYRALPIDVRGRA